MYSTSIPEIITVTPIILDPLVRSSTYATAITLNEMRMYNDKILLNE